MTLPVIGELRPWADPTQLQIHRLPMRAHLPVGDDAHRSLDGDWSFRLFESPDAVPGRCRHRTDAGRRRGWRTVAVPGNWTMQVRRRPAALHQHPDAVPGPAAAAARAQPHRRVPAHVHDGPRRGGAIASCSTSAAPRACTRCTSTARSPGTAPTAGCPASTTSPTSSCGGDNQLAIVVVRYSAHSYVEDQDQWWMAGLHRGVFIEARSPVRHRRRRRDRRPRPRHGRRFADGAHERRVRTTAAEAGIPGAHPARDAGRSAHRRRARGRCRTSTPRPTSSTAITWSPRGRRCASTRGAPSRPPCTACTSSCTAPTASSPTRRRSGSGSGTSRSATGSCS